MVAPLGPRQLVGVVWEPERLKTQEVGDNRLRRSSTLTICRRSAAPLRRLIEWTADYYLAPLASVLRMALPSSGALEGARSITEYRATGHVPERLTPQRAQALERIGERQGLVSELAIVGGVSDGVIRGLVKAGAIDLRPKRNTVPPSIAGGCRRAMLAASAPPLSNHEARTCRRPWPISPPSSKACCKLRSIPFGMKLFADRAEMEAIPRSAGRRTCTRWTRWWPRPRGWAGRSGSRPTTWSARSAARWSGWATPRTTTWKSGKHMTGVWFATLEDATAHQAAMHCVPDGKYEALAVAPLASGRLKPPDIALFYATPGAMMYFINGLQWSGYKRFDWGVVGESACADSWGRALTTREPSLSIPCFAERRYGGVLDDEMLMAMPPEHLVKAIAGMEALAKNGFRYPFPQYGIQQDVRDGMAGSYPERAAGRRVLAQSANGRRRSNIPTGSYRINSARPA